jgi:hypothetical protein
MGSLAGMWALSPLEKLLVSQLIKFPEMDEISNFVARRDSFLGWAK